MFDKIQATLKAGNLDEALFLIDRALENSQNDAQLLNQKALILRRLDRLQEAEACLNKAIASQQDYAASYNHLGLIAHQQAQHTKAEMLFETALKMQSDYMDALYNLALAYRAQNKTTECAAALSSLIEASPTHLPAHFLLAKIFLEKSEWAEANKRLTMLVDVTHNDFDVLLECIQLLLHFERYIEAEPFCLLALKQKPDAVKILYNLAVIAERQFQYDLAMTRYHTLLDIEPNHFESLNNLGLLYLETKQIKTAQFYLEKALQYQPDNQVLQHTVSAIKGEKLHSASKAYITALFDQYADHFENHLLTSLHYQAPEQLCLQLKPFIKESLITLDLGCGTGLMGQPLKPFSKLLVGVDLSQKMLDEAAKKAIYDELICEEITAYLHKRPNQFDLITAADTLVYLGDLNGFFAAAFKALKPDGLLSFSIELAEQDFYLAKSGRFHHAQSYIEHLAQTYNFKVLDYREAATRTQRDEPVIGGLFCLQRSPPTRE